MVLKCEQKLMWSERRFLPVVITKLRAMKLLRLVLGASHVEVDLLSPQQVDVRKEV